MRYFILYTELADYTMNCFKMHLELHPADEIHVIHYPVNAEAPFVFNVPSGLFLYEYSTLTQFESLTLIEKISPELIICSGWGDRFYNKILKSARGKYPVVLCFDNIYRGKWKQRILIPFAKNIFKSRYQAAWVPGKRQVHFAKLLGFNDKNTYTGFYATDIVKFEAMYRANKETKSRNYPKRFLCVARYIPQKGLEYLWKAFLELIEEGATDWELWCAGTGELFEQRVIHEKIKHLGFVQPSEFGPIVAKSGVFVLPSLFEPWGVVVNEFAAAGLPLLLSNKIGSSEAFLQNKVNGFSFKPRNTDDIKLKMKQIMSMSIDELNAMSEVSYNLGVAVNAKNWSETLIRITADSK